MSDRISALTTIIQKNPQSSLSYMQTLINLSKKKNRKQVELAITNLRDLFCEQLLSDDKKLHPFSKNPILQNGNKGKDALLQAYFEHQLKELYSEYITVVLKTMSHDDLEFYRKYALNNL